MGASDTAAEVCQVDFMQESLDRSCWSCFALGTSKVQWKKYPGCCTASTDVRGFCYASEIHSGRSHNIVSPAVVWRFLCFQGRFQLRLCCTRHASLEAIGPSCRHLPEGALVYDTCVPAGRMLGFSGCTLNLGLVVLWMLRFGNGFGSYVYGDSCVSQ